MATSDVTPALGVTLFNTKYFALLGGLVMIGVLARCFYQLFIHPLRKYPGPILPALTRIPYIYHTLRGDYVTWLHDLHVKYGNTIRICPDELSYADGDAWRGIYGHAASGRKTAEKDTRFFGPGPFHAPDIIRANVTDHSRFRRNFSNAFSDRALRDQQPLIRRYADMLVERINGNITEKPTAEIDLVTMYNMATFDIMGDLTFGASLDLLKGMGSSSWMTAVFSRVKLTSLERAARYYPFGSLLLNAFLPRSVKQKAIAHLAACKERVDNRVDQHLDRPDIWGLVLNQKEELKLSRSEMYANSHIFMVAGTETTATALSGLTYQLLLQPEKMERITKEVRETFQNHSGIDMGTLARLEYLNACIEEGLRFYPPVPTGVPRIIPSGGLMVCGELVPAGTAVSVSQWTTYRNPENFKRPNEFLPERWLDDPEFATDKKAALQPFSFGPRNCLGKNLAYHEMRILLANVLYNFDFTLAPSSLGWEKQKAFLLWEKNKLMVRVKRRY
ncbi:hypothetical protein P175DRAFT_0252155 [Aspergillus ochraceoroseus IBT 24754]|uniref:Cytochrome P450 monooxygenase n=3 Tax=Aspergillus subgen. Nidulantes TaxID=2720870 RepID=A0A0F8WS68_9EURO|nr:uncharacterized protein P175DRAFT_0252155 [Aspergillus ochraceoroseus IBT 24754]KKK19858.1 hypothetical protein AOCH_000556 [Aspergillus ochraceoroseus]KKK20500.1 hypothetical protein ARAM_001092 [Aspergillus rambellii]PTU21246.1 hypothetical protein P175DRAFT_0252155 [Aspergillus ochraceoroseus IBT 24754]